MRVLVARGKRVSLLLARERSQRLLVHEGFRATTIKAKVRLGLLVRRDMRFVISAISLDISSGITPRGKGPRVSGQRNPNHQWDRRGHSLFLHPQYESEDQYPSQDVVQAPPAA